jgi:hypothetical protein
MMNVGLTLASIVLNDINITDKETCDKAFRVEMIHRGGKPPEGLRR